MIDCHLKAIEVVNNLENIKVQCTYTDDHILCCDTYVKLKDGRGCMIPFLWVGWEGVAALEYFDSPRARGELVMAFTDRIETALSEFEELFAYIEDDMLDELEESDVELRREVAAFFDITKEDLE